MASRVAAVSSAARWMVVGMSSPHLRSAMWASPAMSRSASTARNSAVQRSRTRTSASSSEGAMSPEASVRGSSTRIRVSSAPVAVAKRAAWGRTQSERSEPSVVTRIFMGLFHHAPGREAMGDRGRAGRSHGGSRSWEQFGLARRKANIEHVQRHRNEAVVADDADEVDYAALAEFGYRSE